jgi:hypothetical protein
VTAAAQSLAELSRRLAGLVERFQMGEEVHTQEEQPDLPKVIMIEQETVKKNGHLVQALP